MLLDMNPEFADGYKSPSQRARRITEAWLAANMYCPACKSPSITQAPDNTTVVDFICPSCEAEYQLKAKSGSFGSKLRDAAYQPMMQRALESRSPHFLFLAYDSPRLVVSTLLLVPGHFIVPSVISPCKPLSSSARRAGWVGCNILLDHIPLDGRVHAINDGAPITPDEVRAQFRKLNWTQDLKVNEKGWLFDVLRCVRSFGPHEFTLKEMYAFVPELSQLHPDNAHVGPKIRQQLQCLRDKGLVRFLGNGRYLAT